MPCVRECRLGARCSWGKGKRAHQDTTPPENDGNDGADEDDNDISVGV
jgi:hypothetical protein